jgi:hypothetical protein
VSVVQVAMVLPAASVVTTTVPWQVVDWVVDVPGAVSRRASGAPGPVIVFPHAASVASERAARRRRTVFSLKFRCAGKWYGAGRGDRVTHRKFAHHGTRLPILLSSGSS